MVVHILGYVVVFAPLVLAGSALLFFGMRHKGVGEDLAVGCGFMTACMFLLGLGSLLLGEESWPAFFLVPVALDVWVFLVGVATVFVKPHNAVD